MSVDRRPAPETPSRTTSQISLQNLPCGAPILIFKDVTEDGDQSDEEGEERERRERKERRERRKTVPEGFQVHAAEPDALDKTLILGSTIYTLGDIWMAA